VMSFLVLMLCSGWIAIHAPDPAGVFLGTGLTLLIALAGADEPRGGNVTDAVQGDSAAVHQLWRIKFVNVSCRHRNSF